MNIIIKRGRSDRPQKRYRGVPIRFDTYSGGTASEAVEVVREAAQKYGSANQRMMTHDLTRFAADNDPKRAARLMEAGVEEIGRQMDPNGTPGIKVVTRDGD